MRRKTFKNEKGDDETKLVYHFYGVVVDECFAQDNVQVLGVV